MAHHRRADETGAARDKNDLVLEAHGQDSAWRDLAKER
jgi:hypothetical protein